MRISPDVLPDSLAVTSDAQVVHTQRAMNRDSIDQCEVRSQSTICCNCRLGIGTTSVRMTDAEVKRDASVLQGIPLGVDTRAN